MLLPNDDPLGDWPLGDDTISAAIGYSEFDATISWQIVIYAATHELISGPSDSPPDQAYFGTMEQAFRVERSVIGSGRIGEEVTIGLGEVRLSNAESDYDKLGIDTAAVGQPCLIRMGDKARHFTDNWRTVLRGYVVGFRVDADSVAFDIRDSGFRLDVPLSKNVYGGTGGEDGGSDLKGKRKPLCFGHLNNWTATLVIPASLAYQLSDGPIHAVSAVYVRGVAQVFSADYATVAAMNAASLSVGQYATCLAAGCIRIAVAGGSEVGQVTVDFSGDKTGGVFVETTADIVRRILSRATDYVDPDELATGTFDALNAAQSAEIGYGVPTGSEETASLAIRKIMAAIGGWAGARRNGIFEVKRFDPPSGIPTAIYDRLNLDAVPALVPLPDDLKPPPWRVRVAHSRNWTVQTTDLAGSVTDARRAYLAEEVRYASAESEEVKTNFPPGKEMIVDAYFRDEADALAEAERRLALWGSTPREMYQLKLSQPMFVHEVGELISVETDRFGLEDGKLLRIAKLIEDSGEGVEIMAVG
jgi:hypothetical protein